MKTQTKLLVVAVFLLIVGFLAYDYITQSGFIFPLLFNQYECAWIWVPQGTDDPDGNPGPAGGEWYSDPVYWGPAGPNYYSFDKRALNYCSTGDVLHTPKSCPTTGRPSSGTTGQTSDPWKYMGIRGDDNGQAVSNHYWVYTEGDYLRWDTTDCTRDCANIGDTIKLDPRDNSKFQIKGCTQAECNTDSDCGSDEICEDGDCVDVECKTNADCNSGETCEDNECVSGPSNCGDGTCGSGETCSNCPSDCGVCPSGCGDGTCSPSQGEDCSNCAQDCACPTGYNCDPSAPFDGCVLITPTCGDGDCDPTEDCSSCLADCGPCAPTCGDGDCTSEETCTNCPSDCGVCPVTCGDHWCSPTNGENCFNCMADCACPSGYSCDPSAPFDGCVRISGCGDGVCVAPETMTTCPADCTPIIGEDYTMLIVGAVALLLAISALVYVFKFKK